MLEIYTTVDTVPEGKIIIHDIEAFFSTFIGNSIDTIIGFDDIILVIDNAVYADGVVSTPFGKTVPKFLSTGCKAVLIYFWLKQMSEKHELESKLRRSLETIALDITECGANAILYLFRAISFEENELVFLLSHCNDLVVKDSERNNFKIDGRVRGGLLF